MIPLPFCPTLKDQLTLLLICKKKPLTLTVPFDWFEFYIKHRLDIFSLIFHHHNEKDIIEEH